MVDIQNDFCPGGNLAVPDGASIVKIANQLQPLFDVVVATKDWHPRDHMSFASNHPGHTVGEVIPVHGIPQILWPDHCVQESTGSEFHSDLDTSRVTRIFYKGTDRTVDSYSAFFDNEHLRSTRLKEYLRELEIETIYVIGLATDYCVKYSCLDAVHEGFDTHVIIDGCRGIDLQPGDIDKAITEMRAVGVKIVSLQDSPLAF